MKSKEYIAIEKRINDYFKNLLHYDCNKYQNIRSNTAMYLRGYVAYAFLECNLSLDDYRFFSSKISKYEYYDNCIKRENF